MKAIYLIILFGGLCHSVGKATYCTARGRFPNNVTEDCRGFTMCLIGGASNFTQYNLTCPFGFVYSHLEEQCTNATSYQCLPSYNCTVAGNFENPANDNCTTYIACVEGINDIVTARSILCPRNTIFDPTAGACVNNTEYLCIKNTEENNGYNKDLTGVKVITDMFEFSGNVSFNSAVCLCGKYLILISFIFPAIF